MSLGAHTRAGKAVWIGLALLAVLHQDLWFWDSYEPLLLGFVPIGLGYHVLISLVAAVLWFLATQHCWPLEESEESEDAAGPVPEGNPSEGPVQKG